MQHWILLWSPDIHYWALFPLFPAASFFSEAISSSPLFPGSLLDTFRSGGLIFWCHIFLSIYTVHEVLIAIMGWFATPVFGRIHQSRSLALEFLCGKILNCEFNLFDWINWYWAIQIYINSFLKSLCVFFEKFMCLLRNLSVLRKLSNLLALSFILYFFILLMFERSVVISSLSSIWDHRFLKEHLIFNIFSLSASYRVSLHVFVHMEFKEFLSSFVSFFLDLYNFQIVS